MSCSEYLIFNRLMSTSNCSYVICYHGAPRISEESDHRVRENSEETNQQTSPLHLDLCIFPPIINLTYTLYPTTNGRSRSSHRAICLSLAPPALSSLHSLPLHPKQQVLHLSLRPAQPSTVTRGTAHLRLSTQSSRRATLATRTEKTKACLPRRSSRRSRSSLAAPATV